MKKPIYLWGTLVLTFGFALWVSVGRSQPSPTASREAQLEKEAVAKVLTAHRYTPPVPLAGPPGLTWYISARSFTTNSLEQTVVGVMRGAHFTVEITSFHREHEIDEWTMNGKRGDPRLQKAEQLLRENLKKELTIEEKPVNPVK